MCGTAKVKTNRTDKLPDGVVLRWYRCLECRDMRTAKPTTFQVIVR